ncbi:IclR family transcriptional regulator [Variovorax sp.]|uniref:IclR family transcriptional regulator n=1 Tax=Variovorax sp. TaxID=1871043 RepID=UPI002D3E6328|nr:IclR family transcriptional regulator C-terminal domain-containing protein [Variovorax sp.]HYP83302.1 IclR family transcriptional regulator C-terminal domain-containing protein [Variovorax sp.]
MTSPTRALAILDLFTHDRPVWQPDQINEALGYARATGYRYVKDLVQAGFLQKAGAGAYALGGRIIELDYQLRQSDPVLLAARPEMDALAAASALDAVLSVLFGGPKVIDTYRASVQPALHLSYGRGRPRPLFRSGAPKILLSGLPRAALLKLYESRRDEVAASGMGETWEAFRAYVTRVRKQGYYRSSGELEPGVGAAVVPVFNGEGDMIAALALVGTDAAIDRHDESTLRGWLEPAARRIQDALG